MPKVDKNQAVINYLIECPQIRDNPLFFNAINAQDENKQIVTIANDIKVNKPYVDGSVLKRYTFTVIDYQSVTYLPVVKIPGDDYKSENVVDMSLTQSIIDWVEAQDIIRHYPDFGEDCEIDSIKTLSTNPNLNGIDGSTSPALAKYSISIQIDYIDNSNKIWS